MGIQFNPVDVIVVLMIVWAFFDVIQKILISFLDVIKKAAWSSVYTTIILLAITIPTMINLPTPTGSVSMHTHAPAWAVEAIDESFLVQLTQSYLSMLLKVRVMAPDSGAAAAAAVAKSWYFF
jgi:hypothetical protein